MVAAKRHHVVVDGSNLATEGRTLPSLAQLDEAVRAYQAEDPNAEIVVVVDASFEHRVSTAERVELEKAELSGEVVSPPAGAIGRGDAFVLRIAERTGATVLSNDSFQEFHAEHPWLFDEGRLVGGKPVPGVGWIFTPRIPVRGAKSRRALDKPKTKDQAPLAAPAKAAEVARAAKKVARQAKAAPEKASPAAAGARVAKSARATEPTRTVKAAAEAAKAPPKASKTTRATAAKVAKRAVKAPDKNADAKPAGKDKKEATAKAAKKTAKAPAKSAKKAQPVKAAKKAPATPRKELRAAIVDATVEALVPEQAGNDQNNHAGSKRRRRQGAPPPAVNDPLAFITFVAAYQIGSKVVGEVASFTSHGAMVEVSLPQAGVLHCYVPLSGLGNPPPTKAREVLSKGERREFVLASLDPQRRMAELALPEVNGARQRATARKR